MLSDVCLSVAYIWLKSRTERPRKTKIGTEVAHVTRDSDTTFKVKRSTVKVTRPLYSPPFWRRQAAAAVGVVTCWPWETIDTLPSVRRHEEPRRPRGRRGAGAYRGGRPSTACWTVAKGKIFQHCIFSTPFNAECVEGHALLHILR